MRRRYVPDTGDLAWMTLDPSEGHEQRGWRPVLVLSPEAYNRRTNLAVICPVTSQIKGYPFEVPLPPGLAVSGVVIADHLKSVDWSRRRAKFVERASENVVADVREKLRPLLGL